MSHVIQSQAFNHPQLAISAHSGVQERVHATLHDLLFKGNPGRALAGRESFKTESSSVFVFVCIFSPLTNRRNVGPKLLRGKLSESILGRFHAAKPK